MIRLSIYIYVPVCVYVCMYVCMYNFVLDVYCMYVSSLLFTYTYLKWFNNGCLSGGPVFSAHT